MRTERLVLITQCKINNVNIEGCKVSVIETPIVTLIIVGCNGRERMVELIEHLLVKGCAPKFVVTPDGVLHEMLEIPHLIQQDTLNRCVSLEKLTALGPKHNLSKLIIEVLQDVKQAKVKHIVGGVLGAELALANPIDTCKLLDNSIVPLQGVNLNNLTKLVGAEKQKHTRG